MQVDRKKSWLIYAMGGGFGHLNRALSLARQAAGSAIHCTILHNSRYSSMVTGSQLWQEENLAQCIKLVEIRSDLPPEKLGLHLSAFFDPGENFFDRLIVDSFPRGLAGELPDLLNRLDLRTKRVLIARDLNPDYVEKFDLLNFSLKQYERILNPGESELSSMSKICTDSTAPWLVRRRDELAAIKQKFLSMEKIAEKKVLVICAGKKEEQETFADIAKLLESSGEAFSVARLFASADAYWPGIDRIAEADVVIGSGGYNTVSECRFAGVPLIALPQARLYDRQLLRAANSAFCVAKRGCEVFNILEESAGRMSFGPLEKELANGAVEAVQMLSAD